jgi:hypothetical protein
VESSAYKSTYFVAFPAGLQKLGQRTKGVWPNGQRKRTADSWQQAERSKITGRLAINYFLSVK